MDTVEQTRDQVIARRGGKREQETVAFDTIEVRRKRLQLSEKELCEEIGYSYSSYNSWRVNKKAPKVAALAAEALVRRQAPSSTDQFVLISIVKGVLTTTQVDASNTVMLLGKKYILVPTS